MKILVVDDEPDILTIVSRWLSRSGHEVFTSSDADRALDLVESNDFNLILTDIMMPGANGLALISRIRDRWPNIPIIVMSVIEDTRVAVLAAQEGIEGYLTKPLDFEKLDELLKSIA